MLFGTNLDGAYVGDIDATQKLQETIRSLRPNLTLVYLTGRDFNGYRELRNSYDLDDPDFLVCNTGTDIYEIPGQSDPEWHKHISKDWKPGRIQTVCENFSVLLPQARQFLYKVSYYIFPEDAQNTLPELEKTFSDMKIKCRVLYSSRWFLDIIPENAGKRQAFEFIIKKNKISNKDVIVSGNLGSDLNLLKEKWRSIVPANSDPEVLEHCSSEMTYKSQKTGPDGLLDGLVYYNVIDK